MTRRGAQCFVGLALAAAASAAAFEGRTAAIAQTPPATRDSPLRLDSGRSVERQLAAAHIDVYEVVVDAGLLAHVTVDQRGIDVSVTLLDPDGTPRLVVDGAAGTRGREHLYWIAETTRAYHVAIAPHRESAKTGRYAIAVSELRPAVPGDADRVAAQDDVFAATHLRREGRKASLEQALTRLEDAVVRFHALGDRLAEGSALASIGQVRTDMGDLRSASQYGERAIALFHEAGDPFNEGIALVQTGEAYRFLGDTHKGLDYYGRALTLVRAVSDSYGEGVVLSDLGEGYFVLHELQRALDYDLEALPLLRDFGDDETLGTHLNNLGVVYRNVGLLDRALETYLEALPYVEKAGLKNLYATLLDNIGVLNLNLDKPEKALEYFNRALPLRRELGNKRGEGLSLDNIGAAYRNMGQPDKGLDYASQALTLLEPIGDRYKIALATQSLGASHRLLGDLDQALADYRRALKLFDGVGDRFELTKALRNIAEIERDQGHLVEARADFEQAIAELEFIRAHAGSHDNRSAFVATMTGHYDSYIDLLMQMHAADPAGGHDREALRVSEQARARSLLELLAESTTDIRKGVDPSLLAREQDLDGNLAAKLKELASLLSGTHTDEQRAAAEREISTLTADYRQLQAEIRERSPRYAALTQPQALDAGEIQSRVLDRETMLLEYALGAEHSYLWAVTSDRISSYQLPPRREIESLARQVYEALIERQSQAPADSARRAREAAVDRQFATDAEALSRMLLGPVADELAARRLVIVPDGALQYIPFAVLPAFDRQAADDVRVAVSIQPAQSYTPLIARHEITTLPSASVLAVLRDDVRDRAPAPKWVAVLADPVFSRDDARVRIRADAQASNAPASEASPAATLLSPLAQATRSVKGEASLRRLLFSRDEADAILAEAPKATGLKAFDFQANRDLVTSGALSQYRVVHFATHGLVDSKQPELSGLVLSLVDEHGRTQDGFLRLREIYNLKLNADLVVLSACQTALGKEVRGEGLISLTRGFMYAGAPRVVASLWQVDDAATAHLMKTFYREMARAHATPSAALRSAQLEMIRNTRWQAGYYWGAFVLQGDWREPASSRRKD